MTEHTRNAIPSEGLRAHVPEPPAYDPNVPPEHDPGRPPEHEPGLPPEQPPGDPDRDIDLPPRERPAEIRDPQPPKNPPQRAL